MEQENNLTVMAFQTDGCSCTLTLKEHGDWSAVTFYIHVLAEILKEPPPPPQLPTLWCKRWGEGMVSGFTHCGTLGTGVKNSIHKHHNAIAVSMPT